MNYFTITVISAASIIPPVGAAMARFTRLQKRYLPFLILLGVGLINEGISFVMIMYTQSNIMNSAIYTLVEFILFLWLFYRLNEQQSRWFLVTAIIGTLVWLFNNFFSHLLWNNHTLFRILSSFTIAWLSMDKVNQVLFNGARELYKKTDLLLCLSFFVYYTYRTFIHIFNLFPIGVTHEFYTRLWVILSFINIITNIVYTIAILWIPKRQEYILR